MCPMACLTLLLDVPSDLQYLTCVCAQRRILKRVLAATEKKERVEKYLDRLLQMKEKVDESHASMMIQGCREQDRCTAGRMIRVSGGTDDRAHYCRA